jgi:crotonobetainyl-CoA:carnitine CoA-transferase CaiB-like acyl-CoA transferase
MFVAGPYCTRLLADAGAEVIKVERPDGDLMRGASPVVAGNSRYFAHMNCGKKSITLDLKSEQGRADIVRLIGECDVLVENFRPGVMDRLGFGYDQVSQINPALIYCSVSGYGQTGEDAHRPAFAPIINAASGFDMVQFGYLNGALDRPMRNRNIAPDTLAATHAYGAIVTALFNRERTGDGQRVDVAMIDCMHNLIAVEYQLAQVDDDSEPLVFAPIRAADGYLMIAPVSQANFAALAKATGNGSWLDDPRFSSPSLRRQHYEELLAEAETWSLGYSAAEAEEIILAAGCPCSRYLTVGESMARPAIAERGAAVEIRDESGRFFVANTPFRFSDAEVGAKPRVSRPGEHNLEMGISD